MKVFFKICFTFANNINHSHDKEFDSGFFLAQGLSFTILFLCVHYKMNGKCQSLTWTSIPNRLKLDMILVKDIKQ